MSQVTTRRGLNGSTVVRIFEITDLTVKGFTVCADQRTVARFQAAADADTAQLPYHGIFSTSTEQPNTLLWTIDEWAFTGDNLRMPCQALCDLTARVVDVAPMHVTAPTDEMKFTLQPVSTPRPLPLEPHFAAARQS